MILFYMLYPASSGACTNLTFSALRFVSTNKLSNITCSIFAKGTRYKVDSGYQRSQERKDFFNQIQHILNSLLNLKIQNSAW